MTYGFSQYHSQNLETWRLADECSFYYSFGFTRPRSVYVYFVEFETQDEENLVACAF